MAELYVARDSRALVATTTKSLVLVAPAAARPYVVTEVGYSIGASAGSLSVGIELYAVTTIGSAAGTTFTPILIRRGMSNTAEATALTNLTTEPTAVEILKDWECQPYGGVFVIQYPLGREPRSATGTGSRIGMRYVNPASGATANIRMSIEWEE